MERLWQLFFIVGLIKNTLSKVSHYFPKPYRSLGGNISVNVDLSNYATKSDLKIATGIDTCNFSLKSYKIDVYKLKTVPVDLSKLNDIVKNEVVKKTVYDKLVKKVNNIDTSGFVFKTKYDTDKSDLEKKIPDASGLVKKNERL